jgi:tetratricopeptide (TPR) repeat protein
MAIKMLEKSTQFAQQFALAWAHLGRSYTANASFQLGGAEHYHKAEAAFAKALSLQPDEIDTRIYLANMYTDTGRVEKAVPLLREALKTNSESGGDSLGTGLCLSVCRHVVRIGFRV